MGKKMIDKKTQRDASRGRKSKAGGGKKSKATQLYTPLLLIYKSQEKYSIIFFVQAYEKN